MVRTLRADYAKVTRETHEVQDLKWKIRLVEARNTAIKGSTTVSSFTSLRTAFHVCLLGYCSSFTCKFNSTESLDLPHFLSSFLSMQTEPQCEPFHDVVSALAMALYDSLVVRREWVSQCILSWKKVRSVRLILYLENFWYFLSSRWQT